MVSLVIAPSPQPRMETDPVSKTIYYLMFFRILDN
jgi:hypothetical protein